MNKQRIKSLIDCDQVLHNWARLLGRIGELCVPAKPDFSHMSFTWDPGLNGLIGQSFISNKGNISLVLSLGDPICFQFIGSMEKQPLIEVDIEGNHYAIVMDFLDLALRDLGYSRTNVSRKVTFKFSGQFNGDGNSMPIPADTLELWKTLRTAANHSCRQMLTDLEQDSEILIWPTNFDTGIFCEYNKGISQYAGFAPADDKVCDVPYYYNSFYLNDAKVVPVEFPDLTSGRWKSDNWAGAVLPLNSFVNIEEFNVQGRDFLTESSRIILSRIET